MGEVETAKRHIDRQDALRTIGCLIGLTLLLVASSFCSRHVRDLLEVLALPTNLYNVFSCVWYALLAVVAYHRLPLLASPAVGGAVAGFSVAFVPLLAYASSLGSPLAAVVGVALFALVYALVTFLFACCLSTLPDLRLAAVAVVGGVIARQLALPLYSVAMDPVMAFAAMAALCVVAAGVLLFTGLSQLRMLRERETLGSLELTNPLSSLWPSRRLFLCALLVPLTYSFGNTLGVPGLSVRRFLVVAALFVLLWYLLVLRSRMEDRLFSLVVLFVMAGLLVAPVVLEGDTFLAHTFLFLASSSFGILMWLLVYSLGVRNIASMAPFFGVATSLQMFGASLGATLGQFTLASPGYPLWASQTVILGVAFAFFAFIWLGLKEFSFTEAIRGVEATEKLEVSGPMAQAAMAEAGDAPGDIHVPGSLASGPGQDPCAKVPANNTPKGAPVAPGEKAASSGSMESSAPTAGADLGMLEKGVVTASQDAGSDGTPDRRPGSADATGTADVGSAKAPAAPPSRASAFEARCRTLAKTAGLTPRETEIFELLAHGRNARYIMDTLQVTRNTAKAHIAHVYTKLGVHSHQELLSLVES